MTPIYCAISVEQELPEPYTNVFALHTEDKWESQCFIDRQDRWFNSWDDDRAECFPTHWLKPITSLSDLPEEWKAEIREIAGKAFDAGDDFRKNCEYGTENEFPTKQKHLKGIL